MKSIDNYNGMNVLDTFLVWSEQIICFMSNTTPRLVLNLTFYTHMLVGGFEAADQCLC